jgi:hypothetical protein
MSGGQGDRPARQVHSRYPHLQTFGWVWTGKASGSAVGRHRAQLQHPDLQWASTGPGWLKKEGQGVEALKNGKDTRPSLSHLSGGKLVQVMAAEVHSDHRSLER